MDEQKNVDVLFLGTLDSQEDTNKTEIGEKSSHHDQISFNDPVLVELIRIPQGDRDLYSRYISKTQKIPIKGFQVYYRNLTTWNSRFSLLASNSSELLASETDDILITLKQEILTDLLVIRGDFKTITLCIYGRVLTDPEQIQKKCPYFLNEMKVSLCEEEPIYKIQRNIFNESSKMVRAIEEQYEGHGQKSMNMETLYKRDIFSNDDEIHEQQIQNISVLSQQLLQQFSQENISQHFLVNSRLGMEQIQTHLAKLFKSAHIGLYYPSSYRGSSITNRISAKVDQITFQSLSLTLSDKCRSLEILKFILQLGHHAQNFVDLGGIQALIRLFVEFFGTQSVILSSFKALLIEVLIALSFWNFAVTKMVEKITDSSYHSLFIEGYEVPTDDKKEQSKDKNISDSDSEEKSNDSQKSRSRSRDKKKKKKKDRSQRSSSIVHKKDKKSKKDKKKKKKRDYSREKRDKSKEKGKDKKKDKGQRSQQRQKDFASTKKQQPALEPLSFYEILIKMMIKETNIKLISLFRILIQQITQTLTKNKDLSNHMAYYTPLLRDTKYMFNQSGEIISSKPLKIFASFQPFLNDEQSKGVDSIYISEIEKLKNPLKYGIEPKMFKILDSIQTTLLSKSEEDIFSFLDEEFITSMSYLLKLNSGAMSIGFPTFVDSLKIDTLLTLKKQEAAISIICQYLYKIFLEDDGINTVLYMDQIHASLLKISTWLKEDKTFSKEIKKKVRFLKNFVISFDYFSGAENTFKNLADYFLRLIKYEHYEISKIKEYQNKDYQKGINPLSITNLEDSFNFGNFFDLLPSQPLLQVDVCLKIFLVLIKFNKNIWSVFYENKLSCGLSSFFMRIHALLKFYLTPTPERYQNLIDLKFYEELMNNYLSVMKRLVELFVDKIHYESAFNELLGEEEDIFDSVELYEKLVDLYMLITTAYSSKDCLITSEVVRKKMQNIVALILEFIDVIMKSHEIIKHQSREIKIKSILRFINHSHYQSLHKRASVLSLIKTLIEIAEPHTLELIKQAYFDGDIKKSTSLNDALLPENQLTVIENIILKNIYRSDGSIIINLAKLMEICLQKNHFKDSVSKIIETIYEENQQRLKTELQEFERNTYTLKKIILVINVLGLVKSSISNKLDDRIIRFFRYIENIRDSGSKDEFDLHKLKLRNSLIKYMANSLENNENSPIILQFLKIITNFTTIEVRSNYVKAFYDESLKSCLESIKALIKVSFNCYYQSFILYGDYFANPYKPSCEISLTKIFSYFMAGDNTMHDEETQLIIRKIGISAFYFLCSLTTIDSIEFYSTESRKNAILTLISPDKSISLHDITSCMETLLPKELVFLMKNYMSFPIMEKQQTFKSSQDEKTIAQKKYIGSYYSKSVFSMIGEGDPVGKTRFEYVQEQWQGGDANHKVFTIENKKNYKELVQNVLLSADQISQLEKQSFFMEIYEHNEMEDYTSIHTIKNPFYSFVAKKTFAQEKKNPADSVINLKNIPKVHLPPQQSKEIPTNKPTTMTTTNNGNLRSNKVSPPNMNHVTPVQTTSPQPRSSSANRNPPPTTQSYTQKPTAQQAYQQPQQARQQYPPSSHQPFPTIPPGYSGYEQNRVYYQQNTPSNDPRYGYPQNYNQPMGYPNQRNMMGPQMGNYYQNPQGYPSSYPSEQDLLNEGIQLIYELKSRPNGSSSEKMKERLNYILKTYPNLNKKINEYFNSYKR